MKNNICEICELIHHVLKDVAWLEDARFIFLIFHTFVCKFVHAAGGKKKYRQIMENWKN